MQALDGSPVRGRWMPQDIEKTANEEREDLCSILNTIALPLFSRVRRAYTRRKFASQVKESTMKELRAKYSWQQAYFDAICETDNNRLDVLLYEATVAIEQRRLSPLEINSEEERAVRDAERGIVGLKAERIEKPA